MKKGILLECWHCNENVTIPDCVTSIGNHAFSDCSNLTSITIPDSVKIIGEGAFFQCVNLKEATIPRRVKILGEEAFPGCDELPVREMNIIRRGTVREHYESIMQVNNHIVKQHS